MTWFSFRSGGDVDWIRLGSYRFLAFQTFIGLAVFNRIPSEISFHWVYFPPFFFTLVLGFVGALGIAKLLNATGLSRFFWHPGLAFIASWALATSLVGLLLIHP
jgi:hypothetical protein